MVTFPSMHLSKVWLKPILNSEITFANPVTIKLYDSHGGGNDKDDKNDIDSLSDNPIPSKLKDNKV